MAEMKSGSTAEGPYLLGMDIGTGGVRVGIFSRISRAGAYLWAPVISFSLIHASAWKGNSRKFTVTSGRRYGFQGCPSLCTLAPPARFKALLMAFVARNCYKPLRLATAQLT